MLIRKSSCILPSEITSKELQVSRRRFMRRAGAIAGAVRFSRLVRLDYTRPLVYAVIVGGLLASRLVFSKP